MWLTPTEQVVFTGGGEHSGISRAATAGDRVPSSVCYLVNPPSSKAPWLLRTERRHATRWILAHRGPRPSYRGRITKLPPTSSSSLGQTVQMMHGLTDEQIDGCAAAQ
jgi:hypothetical protein